MSPLLLSSGAGGRAGRGRSRRRGDRARLAATLSDIGTQVKLEGDVAKAMTTYREAIATDPSYAPARYNLGVALHELGQNADAEG